MQIKGEPELFHFYSPCDHFSERKANESTSRKGLDRGSTPDAGNDSHDLTVIARVTKWEKRK